MAQHLWCSIASSARVCHVCLALQTKQANDWSPPVGLICPGDDEDRDRRSPRRRPDAPSRAPKVLEAA